MPFSYLSLCSGIEAATAAWESLGWIPAAFAEIEKFPSAVLAHHYPSVPNLGDITKISGKDFSGKIDVECEALVFGGGKSSGAIDVSPALNAHGGGSRRLDFASEAFVAHTLRGEGHDASEDGTGRANLIPINLQLATRHNALGDRTGLGIGDEGDPAFTLTKTHSHGVFIDAQGLSLRGRGAELSGGISTALRASQGGSSIAHVLHRLAVRRLTPRECERLQGFPDDYTLIPWRGKPAELCPDGPRYKALGNSMAVPVMRWLGERLAWVENIMAGQAA